MNKKVIKYCAHTLEKMIDYHDLDSDELLKINIDLKKLLLINKINLYKISKYGRDSDKVFFLQLKEKLCGNYIKTEIVRQWLDLFISNSEISFEEILHAADNFNSKTLEINVKINRKIELNEKRKEEIINSILVKVKNETIYENEYKYYIVNIIDKKNKERQTQKLFDRDYVNTIETRGTGGLEITQTDLLNTIFDYFIINKPKKENEYN